VKPDPAALERHLSRESNRALAIAATWATVLAGAGLASVVVLTSLGINDLRFPALYILLCLLASLLVRSLANRERLVGTRAWVVLLSYVSLPTGFFLLSHFAAPAGSATYLLGPLSLLYFVLIALTGCRFDHRLSFAAGVVAAVGYFAGAWLAHPVMSQIQVPHPSMYDELVSLPIYALRGMFMIFTGLVVGALAIVARRFAVGVASEQLEREEMRRLFGEYVSDEVVERVRLDASRHGERTRVVVLFSDLRGFTTFSEGATPEEIVTRLNAYFDAMVTAIQSHGGMIDKFIGDAIMAVFDGLQPLENPAEAAVDAARDMRKALDALNARWESEGAEPFQHGIGIHLGDVVQGSIGSETRKDFTIIGDAVNTASRVEGLTKDRPGAILVTGVVHERLPAELRDRCEALGGVSIRGKAAEIAVYAVPD